MFTAQSCHGTRIQQQQLASQTVLRQWYQPRRVKMDRSLLESTCVQRGGAVLFIFTQEHLLSCVFWLLIGSLIIQICCCLPRVCNAGLDDRHTEGQPGRARPAPAPLGWWMEIAQWQPRQTMARKCLPARVQVKGRRMCFLPAGVLSGAHLTILLTVQDLALITRQAGAAAESPLSARIAGGYPTLEGTCTVWKTPKLRQLLCW